jgi:hypothetical protein
MEKFVPKPEFNESFSEVLAKAAWLVRHEIPDLLSHVIRQLARG